MSEAAVEFSIDSGAPGTRRSSSRRKWSVVRVCAQQQQGRRLRATYKLRPTRTMSEPELAAWVFDTIRRDMGTDHLIARVKAFPGA